MYPGPFRKIKSFSRLTKFSLPWNKITYSVIRKHWIRYCNPHYCRKFWLLEQKPKYFFALKGLDQIHVGFWTFICWHFFKPTEVGCTCMKIKCNWAQHATVFYLWVQTKILNFFLITSFTMCATSAFFFVIVHVECGLWTPLYNCKKCLNCLHHGI